MGNSAHKVVVICRNNGWSRITASFDEFSYSIHSTVLIILSFFFIIFYSYNIITKICFFFFNCYNNYQLFSLTPVLIKYMNRTRKKEIVNHFLSVKIIISKRNGSYFHSSKWQWCVAHIFFHITAALISGNYASIFWTLNKKLYLSLNNS